MSNLTAYCLKTKTKNVPFEGTPVINKNGNRYLCQGVDKDGNKMSLAMGKDNAEAAILTENAAKGTGWE